VDPHHDVIEQFQRPARMLASLLLGAVVTLMAAQVALAATGFQPLVIRSGSMTPTLAVGDIVISRAVSPTSVRAGDIVTFHRPEHGDGLVTHRVMMATPMAGTVQFETRGDANSVSEFWNVRSSGTIGLDVLRIPRVGWAVHVLQSVWLRIGVIVLAGAWTGTVLLRRIWAES
jgi:signal peptidase